MIDNFYDITRRSFDGKIEVKRYTPLGAYNPTVYDTAVSAIAHVSGQGIKVYTFDQDLYELLVASGVDAELLE